MIDDYCTYLAAAGYRPATIALRRAQLHHFEDTVGVPLEQVTAAQVTSWLAQPWAPETRHSYRSAVSGLYRWAHSTGRVDHDPTINLPAVHVPAGQPHPVDDDTYRQALDRAGSRTRLMLRLAAELGLRRGEIAHLHSTDLRRDPGGWVLAVHGKGGVQRTVPVSAGLARDIRLRGPGWIFPSQRGGHVTPAWVGTLCSTALGPKATVHGLRHRFASRAYHGTHDLRAVQTLLGHSSPATTQRYVAVDDAELRAAMNAAA